jgi:extracellular factor (EF) 3-hydroxypalmitic acid methyl ester biosynthesis protein
MDALEASLPWHVVHVDSDSPVRAALINRIRTEFIPVCLRQSVQIDAALRQATGDDWQRLKEFSIRNVHSLFMTAPVLHRARIKPLGYPGDFEVMRYVYNQNFEGTTLFGKAMHLFACACTGPAAVRSRKDMVKGQLRDRLRTWDRGRPMKVASVAAGPAQEIIELLTEAREPLPPLELLLFDQDRLALSYAQGRLSRLVERHPEVKVTYLFDSIKRLLTDPTLFAGFGPFDIIFCAGLFDYLRFHTAVGLTRSFYANLAPGGSAFIGNMMATNPGKWIFEHHLDWYLTYRSHADMLDFGRAAVPSAQLQIVEEATGINPFLMVRKD